MRTAANWCKPFVTDREGGVSDGDGGYGDGGGVAAWWGAGGGAADTRCLHLWIHNREQAKSIYI